MTQTYSNTRYLAAKKAVDDRALNRHVAEVLRAELGRSGVSAPRVIEVGAGLGTMVARLVEWGFLQRADYTLVDVDAACLTEARAWLRAWAFRSGCSVEAGEAAMRVHGGERDVDLVIRPVCCELGRYLGQTEARAELIIANAFLDLVDVAATLPRLLDLLAPNGLYWFTVNFDGETIFQPDHPFDASLLEVYHHSMDERVRDGRRAGDRCCGRHLFGHLRAVGASILAAGGSDWVVHARDGRYPEDEAYFIDHILHTIDAELRGRADVDQGALQEWLTARRRQLQHGELAYLAHQLDFVGRRA